MKKAERKQIKNAFYKYPEMFKTLVLSTVDWAESNFAVDYSKVSVQTSPGNYKETQLCGLIDDNQRKLRWCSMVEKTLEHYHFEKDKVRFVQLYFFKKNTILYTCLEVGICRATFFNWENEILETAYKWAKELRLVKGD